jgi:glycosyltransferase involved in cell wall biosynthesis
MNWPQTTDPSPLGVSAMHESSSESPPSERGQLSILHVYAGNLYGGIETLLATLARCGHLEPSMRMEYALCFPGRIRDELRAAGAVVHDLGPVKFRHPWTVFRARRRMAALLARRRFDVVVIHSTWPHALLAPTVRRAGRPIVYWQHDFAGNGHWTERLAARTRPDLIISNSKASAATLPRLFPDVPAEVVYNPVSAATPPSDPVNARLATRREFGTPDKSVVVIQACRMERWKGHSLLLDALGRLRDRDDWVVWIVGGAQRPHEQTYLAELKARAATLGVADRVRFLGQRDDVPRLLASADVHCQPNIGPEPFGIAFIEALSARLPVVSTRMGGAAEIITEECGVLVEPGDTTALAEALRRLISDPSERARLGQAGPASAVSLSDTKHALRRISELMTGLAAAVTVRESGEY